MDRLATRSPAVSALDAEAPALSQPAVLAGLSYLRPTDARPVSYAFPPPPGTPWESCDHESPTLRIFDARRAPARPSLDHEGFELRDAPSSVRDWLDDDEVRQRYYPEAVALALAATGAGRGIVFDHLVRRREADRPALGFGRGLQDGRPGANGRIHNDYSEASGRRRLELVLPDADARAAVARFAIVNLWRPIKGPVQDTPLALCDARTVGARELVAAEVRYPRRSGEIYLLTRAPQHRWSYYPAMDRHEVLLFKQYDSRVNGVARFVPHAAFDLPEVLPDAPLRESIELRCLVVWA